jgi:hypothetical protein
MPKPPVIDIAHTAEMWAEVRAHEHVMRYRRSGTGRAVLLLHDGQGGEPFWPELPPALDGRFRVIVPQTPALDVDIVGWLADFLEGLGLTDVGILVADELCTQAIELTLLDADQIGRIVLVPRGRGDAPGLTGSLATAARRTTVPLLVVRRGLPAEEALPVIGRFLDGGSPAPP